MNLQSIPSSYITFFQGESWMRGFEPLRLNRGRLIHKRSETVLVEIKKLNSQFQLSFEVKGSSFYSVDLLLDKSGSANASCDCPDLVHCKHIASACYYIHSKINTPQISTTQEPTFSKSSTQPKADDPLKLWLNSLEDVLDNTQNLTKNHDKDYFDEKNKERVVYVLEQNKYGEADYSLTVRKGRILKHGGFRINKTNPSLSSIEYRLPKYVSPTDRQIILEIQASGDYYYPESSIDSSDSRFVSVVEQAAKLGRLFLTTSISKSQTYYPLTLAEDRTLRPHWEPQEGGALRPTILIEPSVTRILDSTPKLFLDSKANEIGLLEQLHSDEFFKKWINGPTVPAEHLNEVRNIISSQASPAQATESNTDPSSPNTPNEPAIGKQEPNPKPHQELSIPLPPSIQSITGVAPQPRLVVKRVETIAETNFFLDPAISQILLGQVEFVYGDTTVTHGTKGKSFTQLVDNTFIEVTRDPKAEKKFLRQLVKTELKSVAKAFTSIKPHSDYSEALLFDAVDANNTLKWLNFFSTQQQELEQKGWTIDTSADLGYSVQEYDEVYEELEETENEWFKFDLGVEHEGKKISLIPALAAALKSGMYAGYEFPEDEAARIPIPIDENNNFINFPAQRFRLILEKLQDLFEHLNKDGEIEMPRLRAATMADDLDMAKANKTLADLAKMGQQLKSVKGLPKIRVPANLKAELREYQVEGFRWLQFLAKYRLHGVLADDMGLGKTIQTLTHILAEKNAKRNKKLPTLIIAPTSVIPNWRAEAAKFTPSLSVLLLHGNERKELFEKIPKHDIIITSYALLQRDQDIHTEQEYHLVVLDESQYIKNAATKTTQVACKLKANHRVCLSGTPMENHLGELWSTFNFLMPGLLQSREKFNTIFRRPIERDASISAQTALQRRVGPLLLRRTKDVVVKELPPKTHIPHHITLNQQQVDLYETVRASMDKRVRAAIAEQGLSKSQIIILDALLKLRQICCHPQLLKTTAAQNVKESAKLDYLTNLLGTLIEEDRRILIFSQFTKMLSLIENHLKKEGIPFVKITGATRDRQTPVEKFQKGEIPVFLISLKAGGTGLNLTAADTVIHYDPWWNPAAENQATDRAYRIGQKNPVFVHKLICRGTIEEHIQLLQEKKAKLVESLLSGSTNKLQLDQDTLGGLLAPIDI